ncbi:hypothetical protein F9B85_02390 [Heliorestis acidaminivorans]|uniref:Uncharacterized protein n=1 Tax=Heliorestis acidaminivorans TaxID=553427 RepID=A0A6I0EVV3_9FIRM|nr:hypothetical protein [Heliorestis acidaminivorans]KAB2954544.1 hypothetical protein F9B85_02390 [Heliorestis acidaminivorans]
MFRKGALLLSAFLIFSLTLFLVRWDSVATFAESEKDQEVLLIQRALQAKGIADREPADTLIVKGDFSPIEGQENILVVNMSKHQAFLAAFEEESNRLIALSKDTSMISKATSFDLPGLEISGIFVEEKADNRLGGFEETTWNRIYRIDDQNVFHQIFAHVQESEYYWHESWDDPKGLYWHGVHEENKLTYPSPGTIEIAKKVKRLRSAGDPHLLPDLAEFTVASTEDSVVTYLWDDKQLRFIEKK